MEESRLLRALLKHRDEIAPSLSEDVLREIADIEERNQFDDDRRAPQKALREIFGEVAQAAEGDTKK